MANLFVMVGVPGSGKSTFAKNHLADDNTVVVSRDEVRFSLIGENDEYFSRENEVYETFISLIKGHLAAGRNVVADATHINPASRTKLLRALKLKDVGIVAVWIKVNLQTALKQNEHRKGSRAFVPRGVIRRMFYSLKKPTKAEGFSSVIVLENGIIKLVED